MTFSNINEVCVANTGENVHDLFSDSVGVVTIQKHISNIFSSKITKTVVYFNVLFESS